ncbi:hypothetical protein DPEC_G00227890 [Dallia pectoralis]|uniref:Uncharacterized protein n=1 Tax=Dallia pectoralis TaxID=75939 RepID=A0ACC2G162_DALPE|nr:hypothetical protein DPEC_G00227890 [Dallia pectoralis]
MKTHQLSHLHGAAVVRAELRVETKRAVDTWDAFVSDEHGESRGPRKRRSGYWKAGASRPVTIGNSDGSRRSRRSPYGSSGGTVCVWRRSKKEPGVSEAP